MKMETLSAVSSAIKTGKTGYGWIVDQNGTVIAFPNKDAILALNITDADKTGYRGLDAFGKQMLSSESGDGSFGKPNGTRMNTYYARIPNSPGWVLGLTLEKSEADATVTHIVGILFLILGCGLVISVSVSFLFARTLVKPIDQVVLALGDMAKGDLTFSTLDLAAGTSWSREATR